MLPVRANGRCRARAQIADAKNGARIPHAVWFQQSKLLDRRERPVRRCDDSLNGDFRCKIRSLQMRIYIVRERTPKILQTVSRKRQSRRHFVPAKLDECLSARS